jgi:hypothetical protein
MSLLPKPSIFPPESVSTPLCNLFRQQFGDLIYNWLNLKHLHTKTTTVGNLYGNWDIPGFSLLNLGAQKPVRHPG